MKVLLLSDIHANLTALQAVLRHAADKYGTDLPVIHLGDVIDYCMRPNETIQELGTIADRFIVNIRGNHEMAYFGVEADRFSSPRGRDANDFTKRILDAVALKFIDGMSVRPKTLDLEGHKLLCVHGDLHDIYWGKMSSEEMSAEDYSTYDFVFSGHTHVPHLHYIFDKTTGRKTAFVNPGSVGQPRNCNPLAQYAVVDLSAFSVFFEAVAYDIAFEQSLFSNQLHQYYRERLAKGT